MANSYAGRGRGGRRLVENRVGYPDQANNLMRSASEQSTLTLT